MKKGKVLDRETAIQKMRKEAKEGIVVVVIILIAFIGLAVALVQSAFNLDEDLSLGYVERNGITEADMSTPAWVASMSYYAIFFVILFAILALLIYFLYSVKKTGIPFTIKNSRILTALSILLMVLAFSPFISLIVFSIVASVTGSAPDIESETGAVGWAFDIGITGGSSFVLTLLLSMFLYVIARIFRYGSFLQDDDEGLI